MLILFLVRAAFACGGFAPTAGALAASDAQQALFQLGANSITVTYRARYEGDAADFAWVLAVSGSIADVNESDGEVLDALLAASQPLVDVDPAIATDAACSCAGASSIPAACIRSCSSTTATPSVASGSHSRGQSTPPAWPVGSPATTR